MKRYLEPFWIFGMMMTAVAGSAVVLLLTTLPGSIPLVARLSAALGGTNVSDAVGHAALFAMMTLLLWGMLNMALPSHFALALAVSIGLVIGTVTEFSQRYVATRSATLSDLLANWLGVLVMGFLISYVLNFNYWLKMRRVKNRPPQYPANIRRG